MCGRFTQRRPTSEIAALLAAEDLANDPGGHYNVAPTNEAAVVVHLDDHRALVRGRWGLVPSLADAARPGPRPFNARAETIATSPLFRDAFRRRRCLVPVDGFYEWVPGPDGRRPFWIHDPAGAQIVLAGLWSPRTDPATGRPERTFTIITTRPNAFMAGIHDRMPVVLPTGRLNRWIDPATTDRGELLALLEPIDELDLDAREVARLVNDVRNDGPALLLPATPG